MNTQDNPRKLPLEKVQSAKEIAKNFVDYTAEETTEILIPLASLDQVDLLYLSKGVNNRK